VASTRAALDGPEHTGATGSDGRGEGDTRRRILEAAGRLVRKDGLRALTVGAVAAEAGVYRAAVSYHFGGKAGLMASLVNAYFSESQEAIAAAARACPAGRQRVRFIAENWLDFVSADEDLLFFEVLGYALRRKELRDQLQALYRRWTELILDLLQDESGLDDAEAAQAALLLRMLIDGIVVERLVNPERDDWKAAGAGLDVIVRLYAKPESEPPATA
jgi:AcrR family transcriptional regulator